MVRWLFLLAGITCFVVTLSAAQSAASSAPPAPGATQLVGRVVNSLTGVPVRQVRLTLMPAPSEGKSVRNDPVPSPLAISDDQGRFEFLGVDPGDYQLVAMKTGYVEQAYGAQPGRFVPPGTTLALKTDGTFSPIEFKLTPAGVVSGKVVDASGEPLSGIAVQVNRIGAYFRGQAVTSRGVRTDDVGAFLVGNLAPGRYVVRAEAPRTNNAYIWAATATDPRRNEAYVPTYYPAAADPAFAVSIPISPGEEVAGIQVWLQKSKVYRVSGKVTEMPPDESTSIQISLGPQNRNARTPDRFNTSVQARRDGTFEFSQVPLGSYLLSATRVGIGPAKVLGWLPVAVTAGDVEGLVISGVPLPSFDLAGGVLFDEPGDTNLQSYAYLRSAEGHQTWFELGKIENDSTFKLHDIVPDRYFVSILSLPDGLYLKSVTVGGADVLAQGLDLSESADVPPIEIVLSRKGATVEGIVTQGNKPRRGAFVTLLPDPIPVDDDPNWVPHNAVSDAAGRFAIKGIPPGKYQIIAWEDDFMEIDQTDLEPYKEFVERVTVKERDNVQVELKLAEPR